LKVFPLGSEEEIDRNAQAQLLQKFARTRDDSQMDGVVLSARITSLGVAFQERKRNYEGIERR
jgi:hypothetical protein